MDIESFLPVQEEIHQWSDRRKKVKRVVIPIVIFVYVDPAERTEMLTLSSVSRYMVLHGQGIPAVIPDEQMERFRFMLDYSEGAIEVCSSPLTPGEQMRIIKGPLAGLEGELMTINGKSKVTVKLDMLSYAHVDMPVRFVERVGKMEVMR